MGIFLRLVVESSLVLPSPNMDSNANFWKQNADAVMYLPRCCTEWPDEQDPIKIVPGGQ